MRFTVRELLLATTLAAFYTMGLSYFVRSLDWSARSAVILVVAPIAVMSMTMLLMAMSARRSLGDWLVGWRSTNWWVPHLCYASAFLISLLWAVYYSPGSTSSVFVPLLFAIQHCFVLFNSWIVLGEFGVLIGPSFVPWNECRLRLDEAAHSINFACLGRLWPPRFPLRGARILIPDEHYEATQRVLAEKSADIPLSG